MRVLFVSQRLPPEHVSGAPLQALALGRALARRGHQVELLTTRFVEGQEVGWTSVGDLPVYRLPTRPGAALRATQAAFAFFRTYGERRAYDVLHGHALSATVLGAAAAAFGPVVLKPSLGGPTGDLAKLERSRLRPVARHLLRRADRLLVLNETIGDELRAVGIGQDRITPTKNGVDLTRFTVADARTRPTVLFVGRKIERKGFPMAEAVVQRVRESHPDIRLRVAAGERTDVDRLLHLADVLLLPSSHEGLPNAALEALASGVPVICRPGTLPPRLRECGAVEEADGVEAMASACVARIGQPKRRPEAIAEYDIDRVAAELESLYTTLVRDNRQYQR